MYLLNNFLNNLSEIKEYKKKSIKEIIKIPLADENLLIKLSNCRILRNGCLVKDNLLIRNGKILDPEEIFYVEKCLPNLEIDCQDLIIAPGFIDIQINGGFGIDFTNDTINIKENLNHVSFQLLKYGVTAYCPTIVSSRAEVYSKLIPQIKKTSTRTNENIGASILGIHLEGPFINIKKVGAHEPSSLSTLEYGIESLKNTYGPLEILSENCRIITLAPELDITGEVIEYLTSKNIVVSLGHSVACFEKGKSALNKGAKCITHLFNAMADFHHRADSNLIGLIVNETVLSREKPYYGIISDGVHINSSALNIAYNSHPDGMILVTDAISAMGFERGQHCLGNKSITIKKDSCNVRRAYIDGTDILCGAVASMNECVHNLMQKTGCSIANAVKCASEHPAKLLNIFPQKGSLNYGADADFIIIDDKVNITATFLNGDLVWSKQDWKPHFKYDNISYK